MGGECTPGQIYIRRIGILRDGKITISDGGYYLKHIKIVFETTIFET